MNKVVIFDIDGTLYDTKIGIIKALNYVLKEFGYPSIPKEKEDHYIGPSVRTVFKEFVGMDEEMAERATILYRKIYVEKFIKYSSLYSDVEYVLEELRLNFCKICIATMKTFSQVDRLLENGLNRDYFDIVKVAREDGSISKKQMLLDIKEEFNEAKCYMVGDTMGDYEASVAAGIEFIGVKYGYGNLKDGIPIIDGIIGVIPYLELE